MKNIGKNIGGKHIREQAPFHLPKLTTLTSQIIHRVLLTYRAFNTSRYHEPKPSKYRCSIPNNINHTTIDMYYECMNNVRFMISLNSTLRSSNPMVRVLDSG